MKVVKSRVAFCHGNHTRPEVSHSALGTVERTNVKLCLAKARLVNLCERSALSALLAETIVSIYVKKEKYFFSTQGFDVEAIV